MINPAAALYAGAFVAGQLGGIALGTAIVKKVLPRRSTGSINFDPPKYFDLSEELDRLGMKNPF